MNVIVIPGDYGYGYEFTIVQDDLLTPLSLEGYDEAYLRVNEIGLEKKLTIVDAAKGKLIYNCEAGDFPSGGNTYDAKIYLVQTGTQRRTVVVFQITTK